MQQWIEKIKSWKKEQILILLLSGVLLLVIALPTEEKEEAVISGDTKETQGTEQAENTGTEKVEQLEQRLSRLLAQVEGIGKAEVMLTLKSNGKKIVEKDTQQSQAGEAAPEENGEKSTWQDSSSESTVVARESSGAESPYVTEELEPEVTGVLVIAQGAGDPLVVAEITEAVEALFGVEAHKIKVMKME